MEVKELVELLKRREESSGVYYRATIYPDGSGHVDERAPYHGWEKAFTFSGSIELEEKLDICEKPPDYESLFCVVDDELHPKLQQFLKSLMEKK